MERIENELLMLQCLREEHLQRYQYAARFAKGVVADCACGVGYAAPLLLANPAVTNYFGFDVNEEAIAQAQKNIIARASFSVGSILEIPFINNSVDTFISLETLEHISAPKDAVKEIGRVLKSDGVFICSVPTKEYENYCSELYGPNPYHQQAFSYEELKDILDTHFSYVNIAVISQEIVSVVHNIEGKETAGEIVIPKNKNLLNGSFIALCSNAEILQHHSVIYTGMSRIDYDKEMLIPLRENLAAAEQMALERWQALLDGAQKNEELIRYKEQAERISEERLEAFTLTENLLRERDRNLAEAYELIKQLQSKVENEESIHD